MPPLEHTGDLLDHRTTVYIDREREPWHSHRLRIECSTIFALFKSRGVRPTLIVGFWLVHVCATRNMLGEKRRNTSASPQKPPRFTFGRAEG